MNQSESKPGWYLVSNNGSEKVRHWDGAFFGYDSDGDHDSAWDAYRNHTPLVPAGSCGVTKEQVNKSRDSLHGLWVNMKHEARQRCLSAHGYLCDFLDSLTVAEKPAKKEPRVFRAESKGGKQYYAIEWPTGRVSSDGGRSWESMKSFADCGWREVAVG